MIKTKFRLFIVAVFGVQATFAQWVSPKFTYLNTNSGLSTIRSNKYWAPTIADLDRDGNYDLILCNHGGGKTVDVGVSISPEMYWGTGTGFIPFVQRTNSSTSIPTSGSDYHGFSAGYFGNADDYPDLIFTLGGANGTRGNLPVTAEFIGGRDNYIVRRDLNRNDTEVDPSMQAIGIDGFGRGRSCFFVDIDEDGDLDLVYNNNAPDPTVVSTNLSDSKFVYEWKNNKFNMLPDIGALKDCGFENGALADINHDQKLDLLYFAGADPLQAWVKTGTGLNYQLDNSYFPFDITSATAVAEIDYDNDGDFDLYIARSKYKTGENDLLLEWDQAQSKYIDATAKAKIPSGGMHLGVSVGDFDNNGFTDVFLGRSTFDDTEPRISDMFLMNKGDNTFEAVTENHGATQFIDGTDGDQGEVFDYNKDGKLDLLGSSKNGLWRMFKNNTENPNGNYVIVRVGRSNSPLRFPSLGASVKVIARKGNNEQMFLRRIGSQGQSHAQSFMDMMHFGLGEFDMVSEITVSYGSHSETTKFKGNAAKAGKTFTVGVFPEIK